MKMNKVRLYIILFSALVLLSGIMAYIHSDQIVSLYIEIFGAVLIFIMLGLISKQKKASLYFITLITFILIFFYSYMFASTKDFFAGFLAIISVFFVSAILSEIFK